ncbi:hypothetical protein B0H13DRAFT_1633654, partial [Mycena leptocephala]
CAGDTRVEIQADIERWLLPQPSNRERIFWITGIAGSGKSTLSATVVDNLRKNHTLVTAQFFISRNIPETIDPNKIIPTIAKQLSEFSPAAARIIYDTLKMNGFPSSREEQVKALLLTPIRELSKSCGVVIILIDALDELQNAAESVLEMLSSIAARDCDLPDNVRFVITSRPERLADISKLSSSRCSNSIPSPNPTYTTDCSPVLIGLKKAYAKSRLILQKIEVKLRWDICGTKDLGLMQNQPQFGESDLSWER